ncbi:DUF4432 family protein [Cohnella caldifontis]|uniref:DUF4432 family protein n=1 Tax=Cohnella caldifontis TaxID=3027471 RepID=UPI0023EBB444|nr:DUF4432 family protein [Cohnella sp. YIM B05605]
MHAYRGQRNYGCRIHDQYRFMGMRVIVLENQLVRISILPDKGTEIMEYLYKPLDLDFMWLTDQGVQNRAGDLPASADSRFSFIDDYSGCWQEIFPNGGTPSHYMGAGYGQHGEVSHMKWDYEIVEDSEQSVAVRFTVKTRLMPFRLTKTVSLRSHAAELTIHEEATNLSPVALRYMWGQHLALGKPFLEEGCRIELPDGLRVIADPLDAQDGQRCRVARGAEYAWPQAAGPDGDAVDLSVLPPAGTPSEIVYVTGFQENGWYRVTNDRLGAGIQVDWDAKEMPYLWFWQEFGDTKRYPWYGRHYNIGLEPFSSYPTHGLEQAVRNGSAGQIAGGETRTFTLSTTLFTLHR